MNSVERLNERPMPSQIITLYERAGEDSDQRERLDDVEDNVLSLSECLALSSMHMCLCNRYGERRERSIIHELRLNGIKSSNMSISIPMTLTNVFQMLAMLVQ